MTTTLSARRMAGGFSWPECPRWYGGQFYFSDMFSGRVLRLEAEGRSVIHVDLNTRTPRRGRAVAAAGIGFLPDGRMLIVSMFEQTVLSFDGSDLQLYADLSELAAGPINDMVVDRTGRAYITQLGGDIFLGQHPQPAPILIVEPDGRARVGDEGGLLAGANGIAITDDGQTLVTAETFTDRILAYDLTATGELTHRRVFAEGTGYPDGICLDAAGAVWATAPARHGLVRVLEGGEITHAVPLSYNETGIASACCLGGPTHDTLYIACGFEVADFEKSVREAQGSIWRAVAPVPAGATHP